jgi:hypothetical protein
MTITARSAALTGFVQTLKALDAILDKTVEQAATRKIQPEVLLSARLGMRMAWTAIIAAELAVGAKSGGGTSGGIGQMMFVFYAYNVDLNAIVVCMGVVGLVALAIAGVSEHLVEGLEELVMGSSITPLFVGMLLLPLFSAIPEALVAFRAANRGRMALAMASTVESSVQLLLFVLPTLVLIAPLLGRFLHLTFPPQALACLGATAFAVHWVTEGNTLTWYQGLLLLSIYAALFTGALLLRPGM